MPFPKNFTPPFTQSQVNINTNINVNIILFQKKRYFNLFLQLRIFTWAILSLEELKDVDNESIFNLMRNLRFALKFDQFWTQVDQ